MNEPPISTFIMERAEDVYKIDYLMERFYASADSINWVMLYQVLGDWVQEVHAGAGWAEVVREKVQNALNAALGTPVYLTMVVATTIEAMVYFDFGDEDEPEPLDNLA